MSNRYRLVKEYPGSPKLESIVKLKDNGGYELENSTSYFMTKDKVEKYPEFWELIVEKEYEILSLKSCLSTIITYENGGGCYLPGEHIRIYKSKEKWLKYFVIDYKNLWSIHSIKRLSDGEVFTVGDEIIYNEIFPTKLKIKSIQLFNGEILIHKDCTMNTNKLSEIQHCKKPTTKEEYDAQFVKKDYEILSFKRIEGNAKGCLKKKRSDGTFGWDFTNRVSTEEELLNNDGFNIHSIKRLSDGEIFTIGDFVRETITGQCKGWEIKEFSLKNTRCFSCGVNINNIKKIKQPLFTTEDGIDIYEGDKFFELIIPGFHNKQCVWNILPNEGKSNLIYDQEGNRKHYRLWFSTKKAAENYIKCNNPCLSYNDVWNMTTNKSSDNKYSIITKKDLEELVKTKLK